MLLPEGEEAFSEPETQAIRDALKAIQASTELYAYITLHSYGQVGIRTICKHFVEFHFFIE
jgi:hypothetical protein